MDRRLHKRPKLYIVNLQWTPKDENATLKINGMITKTLLKVSLSIYMKLLTELDINIEISIFTGRCDDVMRRVFDILRIPIPVYNR